MISWPETSSITTNLRVFLACDTSPPGPQRSHQIKQRVQQLHIPRMPASNPRSRSWHFVPCSRIAESCRANSQVMPRDIATPAKRTQRARRFREIAEAKRRRDREARRAACASALLVVVVGRVRGGLAHSYRFLLVPIRPSCGTATLYFSVAQLPRSRSRQRRCRKGIPRSFPNRRAACRWGISVSCSSRAGFSLPLLILLELGKNQTG